MDSPTFNAGHSAPDPQAAEPAAKPERTPAGVLAQPLVSVPHATAVAGPAGAAAPSAAALYADIETLVTEDDTPVDMRSEKQQRLLTSPLYSFWSGPGGGRSFVAAANVAAHGGALRWPRGVAPF